MLAGNSGRVFCSPNEGWGELKRIACFVHRGHTRRQPLVANAVISHMYQSVTRTSSPHLWKGLWKSATAHQNREAKAVAQTRTITNNRQLVETLQSRIPTMKWSTWFSSVNFEIDERVLRVISPSAFHSQWLSENYQHLLDQAAEEHLGSAASVEYAVSDRLASSGNGSAPSRTRTPPPPAATEPPAPPSDSNGSGPVARLVGKYVFDNFIAGSSNRLALAAAKAVSEQPGGRYNPLFIYGAAGLGKTHLLHAVSHHTIAMRPGARIRYATSENFVNEFIDSIRRKRMDEFKQRYRSVNLLLVDDIQFFEGKEQVLEEVFHTFNALYEADRQMVLTCDRPPKDLSAIEERLRSRFTSGLMTDIGPPDVETRQAILRSNAELSQVPAPDEVLDFIARHITDNIRELEGALNRVAACAALERSPITLELAENALRDMLPTAPGRRPSGSEIMAKTAIKYGFSIADMEGPSRKSELVLARQVAMYLCRDLTNLSFPKIGKLFGNRDHTTVMHAYNKVQRRLPADLELCDAVADLSHALSSK